MGGLIYFMNSALVVHGMMLHCFTRSQEFREIEYFALCLRDVAGGAVIVKEAGGLVFDP